VKPLLKYQSFVKSFGQNFTSVFVVVISIERSRLIGVQFLVRLKMKIKHFTSKTVYHTIVIIVSIIKISPLRKGIVSLRRILNRKKLHRSASKRHQSLNENFHLLLLEITLAIQTMY